MVERRAGALGPCQARSRQRRWPKARLYKGQAQPAIIATSRHGLLSLRFSGYRTCPRGTAPTLRTLAGYPRETAKSHDIYDNDGEKRNRVWVIKSVNGVGVKFSDFAGAMEALETILYFGIALAFTPSRPKIRDGDFCRQLRKRAPYRSLFH